MDLFSALEIRILNGRYIEPALAPLWLEAKVIPYNGNVWQDMLILSVIKILDFLNY